MCPLWYASRRLRSVEAHLRVPVFVCNQAWTPRAFRAPLDVVPGRLPVTAHNNAVLDDVASRGHILQWSGGHPPLPGAPRRPDLFARL